MMDYACPVWRHAAKSDIKSLQVLQSKCLHIMWYVHNLQLQEDLDVPNISEQIRNLILSLESKIPESEKLLVGQLGRYLSYARGE